MSIVKPFLKWVGGKTQIIDDVLEKFSPDIVNYYEPFLGGGSVLLALLSNVRDGKIKLTGEVYASDANPNTINLFCHVRDDVEDLIDVLECMSEDFRKCKTNKVNRKPKNEAEALENPENYYYWTRAGYNSRRGDLRLTADAAAELLFLNKTCFRGVYREGPNGFNVPYGHYTNPTIVDPAHLREVSSLLKDVNFAHQDFRQVFKKIKPGDFIYMDPPYAPENATSFVGYTADGFGAPEHNALFKLCASLPEGIGMLMSNSDVPLVRDSFPTPIYMVKTIECRRAINSKKPGSKTNEVLITRA